MDRLLNALRTQSSALDQAMAQPRFAIVSSVDPGTGNARVMLQPEGTLSGWLPILSPWTGSGWGMCCPPSPGDQVLVLSQEGAADRYYCWQGLLSVTTMSQCSGR
jgi:phage baseplate assembly protein gpV